MAPRRSSVTGNARRNGSRSSLGEVHPPWLRGGRRAMVALAVGCAVGGSGSAGGSVTVGSSIPSLLPTDGKRLGMNHNATLEESKDNNQKNGKDKKIRRSKMDRLSTSGLKNTFEKKIPQSGVGKNDSKNVDSSENHYDVDIVDIVDSETHKNKDFDGFNGFNQDPNQTVMFDNSNRNSADLDQTLMMKDSDPNGANIVNKFNDSASSDGNVDKTMIFKLYDKSRSKSISSGEAMDDIPQEKDELNMTQMIFDNHHIDSQKTKNKFGQEPSHGSDEESQNWDFSKTSNKKMAEKIGKIGEQVEDNSSEQRKIQSGKIESKKIGKLNIQEEQMQERIQGKSQKQSQKDALSTSKRDGLNTSKRYKAGFASPRVGVDPQYESDKSGADDTETVIVRKTDDYESNYSMNQISNYSMQQISNHSMQRQNVKKEKKQSKKKHQMQIGQSHIEDSDGKSEDNSNYTVLKKFSTNKVENNQNLNDESESEQEAKVEKPKLPYSQDYFPFVVGERVTYTSTAKNEKIPGLIIQEIQKDPKSGAVVKVTMAPNDPRKQGKVHDAIVGKLIEVYGADPRKKLQNIERAAPVSSKIKADKVKAKHGEEKYLKAKGPKDQKDKDQQNQSLDQISRSNRDSHSQQLQENRENSEIKEENADAHPKSDGKKEEELEDYEVVQAKQEEFLRQIRAQQLMQRQELAVYVNNHSRMHTMRSPASSHDFSGNFHGSSRNPLNRSARQPLNRSGLNGVNQSGHHQPNQSLSHSSSELNQPGRANTLGARRVNTVNRGRGNVGTSMSLFGRGNPGGTNGGASSRSGGRYQHQNQMVNQDLEEVANGLDDPENFDNPEQNSSQPPIFNGNDPSQNNFEPIINGNLPSDLSRVRNNFAPIINANDPSYTSVLNGHENTQTLNRKQILNANQMSNVGNLRPLQQEEDLDVNFGRRSLEEGEPSMNQPEGIINNQPQMQNDSLGENNENRSEKGSEEHHDSDNRSENHLEPNQINNSMDRPDQQPELGGEKSVEEKSVGAKSVEAKNEEGLEEQKNGQDDEKEKSENDDDVQKQFMEMFQKKIKEDQRRYEEVQEEERRESVNGAKKGQQNLPVWEYPRDNPNNISFFDKDEQDQEKEHQGQGKEEEQKLPEIIVEDHGNENQIPNHVNEMPMGSFLVDHIVPQNQNENLPDQNLDQQNLGQHQGQHLNLNQNLDQNLDQSVFEPSSLIPDPQNQMIMDTSMMNTSAMNPQNNPLGLFNELVDHQKALQLHNELNESQQVIYPEEGQPQDRINRQRHDSESFQFKQHRATNEKKIPAGDMLFGRPLGESFQVSSGSPGGSPNQSMVMNQMNQNPDQNRNNNRNNRPSDNSLEANLPGYKSSRNNRQNQNHQNGDPNRNHPLRNGVSDSRSPEEGRMDWIRSRPVQGSSLVPGGFQGQQENVQPEQNAPQNFQPVGVEERKEGRDFFQQGVNLDDILQMPRSQRKKQQQAKAPLAAIMEEAEPKQHISEAGFNNVRSRESPMGEGAGIGSNSVPDRYVPSSNQHNVGGNNDSRVMGSSLVDGPSGVINQGGNNNLSGQFGFNQDDQIQPVEHDDQSRFMGRQNNDGMSFSFMPDLAQDSRVQDNVQQHNEVQVSVNQNHQIGQDNRNNQVNQLNQSHDSRRSNQKNSLHDASENSESLNPLDKPIMKGHKDSIGQSDSQSDQQEEGIMNMGNMFGDDFMAQLRQDEEVEVEVRVEDEDPLPNIENLSINVGNPNIGNPNIGNPNIGNPNMGSSLQVENVQQVDKFQQVENDPLEVRENMNNGVEGDQKKEKRVRHIPQLTDDDMKADDDMKLPPQMDRGNEGDEFPSSDFNLNNGQQQRNHRLDVDEAQDDRNNERQENQDLGIDNLEDEQQQQHRENSGLDIKELSEHEKDESLPELVLHQRLQQAQNKLLNNEEQKQEDVIDVIDQRSNKPLENDDHVDHDSDNEKEDSQQQKNILDALGIHQNGDNVESLQALQNSQSEDPLNQRIIRGAQSVNIDDLEIGNLSHLGLSGLNLAENRSVVQNRSGVHHQSAVQNRSVVNQGIVNWEARRPIQGSSLVEGHFLAQHQRNFEQPEVNLDGFNKKVHGRVNQNPDNNPGGDSSSSSSSSEEGVSNSDDDNREEVKRNADDLNDDDVGGNSDNSVHNHSNSLLHDDDVAMMIPGGNESEIDLEANPVNVGNHHKGQQAGQHLGHQLAEDLQIYQFNLNSGEQEDSDESDEAHQVDVQDQVMMNRFNNFNPLGQNNHQQDQDDHLHHHANIVNQEDHPLVQNNQQLGVPLLNPGNNDQGRVNIQNFEIEDVQPANPSSRLSFPSVNPKKVLGAAGAGLALLFSKLALDQYPETKNTKNTITDAGQNVLDLTQNFAPRSWFSPPENNDSIDPANPTRIKQPASVLQKDAEGESGAGIITDKKLMFAHQETARRLAEAKATEKNKAEEQRLARLRRLSDQQRREEEAAAKKGREEGARKEVDLLSTKGDYDLRAWLRNGREKLLVWRETNLPTFEHETRNGLEQMVRGFGLEGLEAWKVNEDEVFLAERAKMREWVRDFKSQQHTELDTIRNAVAEKLNKFGSSGPHETEIQQVAPTVTAWLETRINEVESKQRAAVSEARKKQLKALYEIRGRLDTWAESESRRLEHEKQMREQKKPSQISQKIRETARSALSSFCQGNRYTAAVCEKGKALCDYGQNLSQFKGNGRKESIVVNDNKPHQFDVKKMRPAYNVENQNLSNTDSKNDSDSKKDADEVTAQMELLSVSRKGTKSDGGPQEGGVDHVDVFVNDVSSIVPSAASGSDVYEHAMRIAKGRGNDPASSVWSVVPTVPSKEEAGRKLKKLKNRVVESFETGTALLSDVEESETYQYLQEKVEKGSHNLKLFKEKSTENLNLLKQKTGENLNLLKQKTGENLNLLKQQGNHLMEEAGKIDVKNRLVEKARNLKDKAHEKARNLKNKAQDTVKNSAIVSKWQNLTPVEKVQAMKAAAVSVGMPVAALASQVIVNKYMGGNGGVLTGVNGGVGGVGGIGQVNDYRELY